MAEKNLENVCMFGQNKLKKESQKCKNFFLSAVFTPELKNRIKGDRLVEKYYDIIDIFEKPAVEEEFFRELFHYSLRLI
ncbi:MAG: hypothetical protein K0B11_14360 [Mariniphaga sp.]|nr:hypothetical protein [Mariniphaga sp.]